MASDFGSANFNSYTSGVGSLLQTGRGGGEEKKDISLFVSNIPVGLTRVGFVQAAVHHSACKEFLAYVHVCVCKLSNISLHTGWPPKPLLQSWHSEEGSCGKAQALRQEHHLWVSPC